MNRGNISIYTIKKAISTKNGEYRYEAEFVTDNKRFTKCTLLVRHNWRTLTFKRTLKCLEGDGFNSEWGQQKALACCLERYRNYCEKEMKEAAEEYTSQFNKISARFEVTIEDVHKGKDTQLKLFKEE